MLILPDKWCWATLNELMKKIVDGTHHTPTYVENGVPFLSVKDIRDGKVFFDNCKYISQEEHEELSKRCHPEFGDLLITKSGTIGRCAVIKTKKEFSLFVSVALLKPANHVNIDYISLAFQSWFQNINVQNDITGTAIKNFHLVDFRQLSLPIAPQQEQRRLVTKIESLKARTARVKDSLSTIPALLDQFRQSVLAAAFRGALTADWREQNPDVEPASVLLEKIRLERRRKWEEAELAKMTASGKAPSDDKWKKKYKDAKLIDVDNLPKIPDNWIWVTADDLCYQITDGEHNQPPYQSEGFPMLTAKHVQDGFVDMGDAKFISKENFEKSLLRCAPENGDLLIVSVGATTGRAAIVFDCPPFAVVRSVLLLKPLLNVKFILNWIRSHWCQSWIGGASGATAQAHLYINDTKRMPVPLPPEKEQQEIVHQIQLLFKTIDTIEKQYQETFGAINQLDQTILTQAFRGALVPQDPNDEPASVLLERIRAEREKNTGATSKRSKKSPDTSPSQTNKNTGATPKRSNKGEPFKEAIQMKLELE